jgi:hypothetical protein
MDPETSIDRVDVDGAARETAKDATEALENGDTRPRFSRSRPGTLRWPA